MSELYADPAKRRGIRPFSTYPSRNVLDSQHGS